jgi:hypothetical protein
MSEDLVALGTQLLQAFACSDLGALEELCGDHILLFGTDESERWHGKEAVLAAFEGGTYDLAVEWIGAPMIRGQAVVGEARFTTPDGATQDARVTLVFVDGRCVHGHYSVPVTG